MYSVTILRFTRDSGEKNAKQVTKLDIENPILQMTRNICVCLHLLLASI